MIRAFQITFVLAAVAMLAACSHFREAKQRLEYRGFLEDWGVNKPHNPWIYVPVLFAVLLLASCSTVSVTRTPSGALHAGVTSFVGKQTIADATVTTREGDTIRINGYSTQNPDPETVEKIGRVILMGAGINAAQEVLQPAANSVGTLIAP